MYDYKQFILIFLNFTFYKKTVKIILYFNYSLFFISIVLTVYMNRNYLREGKHMDISCI